MSHNVHEQLPSPQSSGKPSGATRDGRMRWATATAAAILTLGLTPAVQAAEGALDPSFGVTSTSPLTCKVEGGIGIMTCDFAALRDAFFGGKILPDGRILGGGVVTVIRNATEDTDLAVARFNGVDGGLDTAFGVGGPDGRNGIETTDIPTSVGEVRDLALQDDDGQKKIVVVGRFRPGGGSLTFVVARYTQDGQLDTGFATNGITTDLLPNGATNGASRSLCSLRTKRSW